MRDLILSYLGSAAFNSFIVSTELPFSQSGTELYLKNVKRIYVDEEQIETTPFIAVFNGCDINQETTLLNVYFATDAKNLVEDYSDAVDIITAAKDIEVNGVYTNRISNVQTQYKNDLLITTVELSFTKLL
jgi:hypothetical protein